jgi:hypothetical protein
MRPRDVARLKLLALVEMRGSAVVLTPIGVRRVAKLQIVEKRTSLTAL